jgi:hypothetical protein
MHGFGLSRGANSAASTAPVWIVMMTRWPGRFAGAGKRAARSQRHMAKAQTNAMPFGLPMVGQMPLPSSHSSQA